MTRKIIRVGTSPNDGTGDSLRETANKINYNFAELYNVFGIDGCGTDIDIHLQPPCGNDLILSTCGTGKVIIGDPTNPTIVVSPADDPGPLIIKPTAPTQNVVIGDPECGSVVQIPGCTTEEPIVIGQPVIDPEVGPTTPTIIIPTLTTDPIVVDPGPDGEVKIGHTDPTPTDPTAPHPPQITVPADPNKPITLDPGSGGGGGTDGGVNIGDPNDPTIKVPPKDSTDKTQIGSETHPVDVVINSTGQGPWEVVFTNAEKKLDSDVYLLVQEPKDENHSIPGYGLVGRNKQFAASNFILEPHLSEPDPLHPTSPLTGVAGLYFTRPETDLTKFGEAQNLKALNPTRRAGYIKYWSDNGGNEYTGMMQISPWYQPQTAFNTNLIDYDFATDNQGIFISRKQEATTQPASTGPNPPNDNNEPNAINTWRTTHVSIAGGAGHQALTIGGSLDFAQLPALGGQYTSNHPQYAAGANLGYSYIVIPALHTANGQKYVGQISSNPKRIRKDDPLNPSQPWSEKEGIPFWSLGYKLSTQLQENYPSGGIAQYERIPDNHAISWDVRGRVSINEATLDETLNILGSLKIQVASTANNPNGVVNSNYRTGRKQTGQETEVGIYFADGTFQYTAWLGAGAGKSVHLVGTTNEVEVTGPVNGVYTVGLPDDVTITGNLTVNGTTTTINSTTLTVDDKNIEMGSVATPTDDTANGGGITLKGATDKTIIWNKTKDRWVFNKGVDVVDAVVNNLTANKFVKTDADKKLISDDITWDEIQPAPCGNDITIGNDCDPNNGKVKIPGNGGPITVGDPSNPSITVPPPSSTDPVKIGKTGGPAVTVPPPGSTDPIKIGDQTNPALKVPTNNTDPVEVGRPGQPAKVETGLDKWELIYTGADGKLDSSPFLKVTQDDKDNEGKSLHLHAALYDTGMGNSKLQSSIYFVDDVPAGSRGIYQAESTDTKRAASIRFVKQSFGQGLIFSPYDNYNDTSFHNKGGVSTWRSPINGNKSTKTTVNDDGAGPGIHGLQIGRGAIGFFQDLEGGSNPDTSGLAYMILPGIPDGTGVNKIGQVFANPYRNRTEDGNSGIPYFGFGWKTSTQLIENGAGTYEHERAERTPGTEVLTWHTTNRVGVMNNNPHFTLSVTGDVAFTKTLRVGDAENPGTNGQVLVSTGSTTAPVWQNLPTDQNTTYSQSAETATGGALLRLTDSAGTNDDIKLTAGTNVTITRTDANTITFASTDTNTTYTQSAETATGGALLRLTGSDTTNDDIKLAAGSNMTITRTDANTVTFEAGDTFFNKGTGSGDLVFNRADGTVQMITLTGNVTSVTLVGVGVAKSFTIIFKQDGTGGRTLTTAPEFKFASGYKALSNAANSIDMLNIFSDGTTFYCTLTTGYA